MWGGIGSAIGGLFGYKGAKDQNIASAQQAQQQMAFQTAANQKQMDFQERMSNTAIQRRMADLKKGGLNPILAGKYDASAPSGATSAGQQAPVVNKAAASLALANSAQSLQNLKAQEALTTNSALKAHWEAIMAEMKSVPSQLGLAGIQKLKDTDKRQRSEALARRLKTKKRGPITFIEKSISHHKGNTLQAKQPKRRKPTHLKDR